MKVMQVMVRQRTEAFTQLFQYEEDAWAYVAGKIRSYMKWVEEWPQTDYPSLIDHLLRKRDYGNALALFNGNQYVRVDVEEMEIR